MLLGVWLVLVAMIVLSVRPRRFGLSVTMQWTILVAGIGLIVVAGYQLFTTDAVGRSVSFLTFVVLTIALAGAWIVWRGATLFIAVLVGFVFVWGLFSHTAFDGASGQQRAARRHRHARCRGVRRLVHLRRGRRAVLRGDRPQGE